MTVLVILIFSLFTSLYHETQAAPSPPALFPHPSLEPTLPSHLLLHNSSNNSGADCHCLDTRTLLDIIWTCFTTVLICTWVSVHPNVPPEDEPSWRGILRRVKIMFWALIAPELIVGWAIRQWVTSRKIAKDNSHRGWTQVHGFLFVMGGFSLMKDDEDLGTLSYALFIDLLRAGDIDFPVISVQDITEKSKGDLLSKVLVILQTTWFIIECIGRGALGFAITELEIVTLALCSLNAITYFFWWHKPLDIERRVPIYLKPESTYRPEPAVKEGIQSATETEGKAEDTSGVSVKQETENPTSRNVGSFPLRSITNASRRLRNAIRKDMDEYNIIFLFLFVYPIGRPLRFIFYFLGHIYDVYMLGIMAAMIGNDESENIAPGVKRVNTFYSPELQPKDDVKTSALNSSIGCAFGALHCIAWSFHFPTPLERSIWRAVSLIITFVPLSFVIVALSSFKKEEDGEYRQQIQNKFLRKLEMTLLVVIVVISTGFYMPCRMILLIQSFIALRDVPPSVYLAFNWQNYIPHLYTANLAKHRSQDARAG